MSKLVRTGASSGLVPFTFAFCGLWQFMHVCAAGTFAVRPLEDLLVAVGAIHAELADVEFVREGDGLLGPVTDAGAARQA